MLTWQAAAVIAAALLVAGLTTLRLAENDRVLTVAPFVREAGVVMALYSLWQYAGGLSLGHTENAVGRGLDVWRFERPWLPSEAWLQRGILHHSLLVQACNIYYATMHFGMLMATLLWLYARHREAYARVRTTIIVTTTACLVVGFVPVAPPRLIHVGMVDTALAYGESVYSVGAIGADQYSAMPSVHVAWAAIVALAVMTTTRSRWRWLILLHFAATVYVVVVTANHFWSDGIVAVALLALSVGLQASFGLLGRRVAVLRQLRAATRPAPVVVDETDGIGAR